MRCLGNIFVQEYFIDNLLTKIPDGLPLASNLNPGKGLRLPSGNSDLDHQELASLRPPGGRLAQQLFG